MDLALPNAPKAVVANGMAFQALFLGANTYGTVRSGEDVNITCSDGTIVGKVQSVSVGPMAQFLGTGLMHAANVGKPGGDVRSVIDDLEARYVSGKDTKKALDPRTLYTAVIVAVPYVPPVAVVPPAV